MWSLRLPLGHRLATATLHGRPVEVDRAAEAVRLGSAAGVGAVDVLVTTEVVSPD